MPIPDFQSLMRPLLVRLQDREVHRFADLAELVAKDLGLTEADLAELLPSGGQGKFRNRLHWAGFYLLRAGLLQRPKRAWLQVTDRGVQVLASGTPIDAKYLQQFEEFREFQKSGSTDGREGATVTEHQQPVEVSTPEELLEKGYSQHRAGLATELLAKIMGGSPAFFERLVVELLVNMGYGGSLRDAGSAIGRPGDGGIDGVIKGDRLGLDAVYVQAKRWEGSVGRPVVQGFAGSLEGHRARKGVLITTSDFTADARDYVRHIEKRIVLINGKELTELMIEFGVGVTDVQTYVLKRLDTDYFDEEDV